MPRLYFDFLNDQTYFRDEEGFDCPSLETGRSEVLKTLGEIAREAVPKGGRSEVHRVRPGCRWACRLQRDRDGDRHMVRTVRATRRLGDLAAGAEVDRSEVGDSKLTIVRRRSANRMAPRCRSSCSGRLGAERAGPLHVPKGQ